MAILWQDYVYKYVQQAHHILVMMAIGHVLEIALPVLGLILLLVDV